METDVLFTHSPRERHEPLLAAAQARDGDVLRAATDRLATAPISLEVPTLEQLLLRSEETKPILAANVDETEANRRIAQANIDALSGAGAFKVTISRRFGGYEMTIREKLEVPSTPPRRCTARRSSRC